MGVPGPPGGTSTVWTSRPRHPEETGGHFPVTISLAHTVGPVPSHLCLSSAPPLLHVHQKGTSNLGDSADMIYLRTMHSNKKMKIIKMI